GQQRLESRVVMARTEHVGRQEDRECAGRVLQEEIAIRDTAVEDGVRETLVEVDVAVTRRPEETAVGDDARREVDRDRRGSDDRGATAACRWQEPGRSPGCCSSR